MLDIQTDTQTNPHHGLTADVFRVAVFKLHNEVPPPNTRDPALIQQFVNAGIAQIASMVPANADEVGIAVRVLSAEAQASDCIRHARGLFNDPAGAMKCHALANHYQRTANAARSLLLRVQTARHRREAVPATCSSDAWTVHATESLLIAAATGDAIAPPPREPPPPPPAPTSSSPATTMPSSMPSPTLSVPPRSASTAAFPPTPPGARPSRTSSTPSSPAPAPSSA